jgi:hypothetical protein
MDSKSRITDSYRANAELSATASSAGLGIVACIVVYVV